MNYVPNGLIPMDELHWHPEDESFTPLTPEEYDKIIIACHKSRAYEDFEDFENLLKLIRWAENIKVGQLLLKGVFDARLGISLEPGSDEPTFYINTDEEIDEYRDACQKIK